MDTFDSVIFLTDEIKRSYIIPQKQYENNTMIDRIYIIGSNKKKEIFNKVLPYQLYIHREFTAEAARNAEVV